MVVWSREIPASPRQVVRRSEPLGFNKREVGIGLASGDDRLAWPDLAGGDLPGGDLAGDGRQRDRFFKMLRYLPAEGFIRYASTRTATAIKLPHYGS